MAEVVHPRDRDAVVLRPCPPWCTLSQHFADGEVVDGDEGYHHYGPEVAVPTSDRMHRDAPETVVRTILKSWTHPLGSDPGPALIEINLGTAEERTDASAEMTPGQARAVAAALLKLADTAEHADGTGTRTWEAGAEDLSPRKP
ncbi:MAG TPA: hypothetical protein VGS19_15550 [Streptosporangiaceae bacterium]|nr:hypothetical protein [Streptosporangiaceae bacterium]